LTKTKPISVVGGTGVGLLFTMPSLPMAGQTVLASAMTYIDGGKAAGQAMAVARLHAKAELISAIGDDPLGDRLHAWLVREHVGLTGLARLNGESSMLAAVEVDANGENSIVVALNAMAAFGPDRLARYESVIAESSLCLVSLELPIDSAIEALRIARAAGVTTVLNPAPAPPTDRGAELIELSDVITPNETEAAALVGMSGDPGELASRLLDLGAGSVAMTLGADGVLFADASGATRVPAPFVPPASIVDTAGAGDGFNAALCVALTRGHSRLRACGFGVEGGARIIQGEGIVDALDQWSDFVIEEADGI
jgi:ribokinase